VSHTPTDVTRDQPRAGTFRPVGVEHLTTADVHELSTATINALIPHNRALVAQLIVEAGREGEKRIADGAVVVTSSNCATYNPTGEKARAAVNGEETEFLSAFN
jgi:hypothetical protein